MKATRYFHKMKSGNLWQVMGEYGFSIKSLDCFSKELSKTKKEAKSHGYKRKPKFYKLTLTIEEIK